MNYFITNDDLVETIMDINEAIEDRQYALSMYNKRKTGYQDDATAKHVQLFCDNNQ